MLLTVYHLHGGEKETSIMLHLCKEHVKPHIPQQAPTIVPQDFMDYFDVTELTEDGYWGFPEAANQEKGRRVFELTVECALDYINENRAEASENRRPQGRVMIKSRTQIDLCSL